MTDREKVKAGLECLTHVDEVVYKRECEERQCPYRNMDCEIAVMEDALKLLEAQEPMVLNVGDFYAEKMVEVEWDG